MKIFKLRNEKLTVSEIYSPEIGEKVELPLFMESVSAGFPSPADDYLDRKLDLNEYLIRHPASTFFVRVRGDSMINAGIYSGDVLVVDRSIEPRDGNIIIASLDGELTVKRLRIDSEKFFLMPENSTFEPFMISGDMQFEVWGVVTTVIHSVI